MHWYIEVLKKYAVFSGRARRKEYWMFFLFNLLISGVIGFIAGIFSRVLPMPELPAAINLTYNLALCIPSIAVGVRRLHDTGRSGWWIIVPIVNFIFMCFDSEPGTNKYGQNPKEQQGAVVVEGT